MNKADLIEALAKKEGNKEDSRAKVSGKQRSEDL
jgi:hypothetical protein